MTAQLDVRGSRVPDTGLEARPARRRAAPVEPPPLTRRELRELGRLGRGGRRGWRGHRGRRVGRWWRPGGRPPGGRGPGSPVLRRLLLVVAVTAVLAAGVLGLVAHRQPSAGPAGTAEATATTTAVAGGAGASDAPSPTGVLQGLLDARAAALTARDVTALARAEQAGSAVADADGALVGRLVAARQRYDGLAFSVHDAVLVSRASDCLVLDAVVDRAPYELVGADGSRTPQAASPGTVWRYTLVRTAAGWRLAEVDTSG